MAALINPYLNFPGNAEDAFIFYKSIFGGDFAMIQRFKDTPEAGNVAAADQNKIMHIALPIGKGNILMATDAIGSHGESLKVGNNFHLSISTDTKVEADKIFNGLSSGGQATMPMSQTFWGSYFGMLTDKFGIPWMISYDEKRSA
jgi:PhnB protein